MRRRIVDDVEKRSLVAEWRASGLGASQFGKLHGIHEATLRSWGRAIRDPGPAPARSLTRPVPRTVEVIEVGAPPPGRELIVEVTLGNGRRLSIIGEFDAQRIAELAGALEAL